MNHLIDKWTTLIGFDKQTKLIFEQKVSQFSGENGNFEFSLFLFNYSSILIFLEMNLFLDLDKSCFCFEDESIKKLHWLSKPC